METYPHDLCNLFRQLGLSVDAGHMDAFIATHRITVGSNLWEASFWTPVQAGFLKDAIAEDSDWATAVDDLTVRLS